MNKIQALSLLFCGLLCAPGFAQFSEIALTREDIISLYQVPIDAKPAKKFEWKFETPKYCRLVVEERGSPDAVWKVRQASSEDATEIATLTILIDRGVSGSPGHKNDWLIEMRWGFKNSTVSGWGGRDAWIPAPEGNYDIEWSKSDPNEVFVLRSKTGEYRIRIEESSVPFK